MFAASGCAEISHIKFRKVLPGLDSFIEAFSWTENAYNMSRYSRKCIFIRTYIEKTPNSQRPEPFLQRCNAETDSKQRFFSGIMEIYDQNTGERWLI